MTQYEKAFDGRFTLFPAREKKHQRSPDRTGSIELKIEEAMKLADWIVAQPGEVNWNGDTVIKISLAGWDKTSEKNPNLTFTSGFVSANKNTPTTKEVF